MTYIHAFLNLGKGAQPVLLDKGVPVQCYWVQLDGEYCQHLASVELDRPYCQYHAEQRSEPCEHGLDYQLCAGPGHYPTDY